MKKLFKNKFALTEKGAGDLIKATAMSFLVYVVHMLPVMLLMLIMEQLLMGEQRSTGFYVIGSVAILIVMYFTLRVDYDTLYITTYRESANLRMDIASILTKLPLSYFSKHDLSDISQTIMDDVERIEHALGHAIAKSLGFALFFPIMAVLLFLGNVKLGLAVIIPILVNFLLIIMSKKIQVVGTTKHYKRLRENSESFQEAIEMQQEIKSFGMMAKMKNSLYEKMDKSEKIQLRAELKQAVPVILSGLCLQMSLSITILVGAFLYQAGEINILFLLGYILAAIKIKEGVENVALNLSEMFYLDARIKRIKEMREAETQEGGDKEITDYNIELENVAFAYDEDAMVLEDVTFTACQNETTALVGMSGCGKTSILRLISRLYDYQGGRIKIGGLDIKDVSTKSLFEKISIVFQDVSLFNASIMDNIRLGRMEANDEEVLEAAYLAGCQDFVYNLPNKYDTVIGENGATLSGGERQRISIARAFLKGAPILILDEIAAALDVDNEKKIQDSLNHLMEDKTVVIISHRMRSIENVDKIVVIDQGRVESAGSHCELMESSTTYANLVHKSRLAESFEY